MTERFIHMRSNSPIAQYAAVSVGYQIVTSPEGETRIVGQMAMCSHKDQFSRKIARLIINGRMKKYGPNIMDVLPEGMSSYDYIVMKYHPDNFEIGTSFIMDFDDHGQRRAARPADPAACAC